ncbi:hypothetical protein V6N12_066196 [Hibiscus sabdariffa]|uniref:Uncharacterized protein n=1 Tax=Hibiscus sabdariffa TaxID=183260 RepID=A0ABR2B9K8_9ROSI
MVCKVTGNRTALLERHRGGTECQVRFGCDRHEEDACVPHRSCTEGKRTKQVKHEWKIPGDRLSYDTTLQGQDSPVVYRLRKNSEFRLNDNSIWGPPNHRELLIMHDSNHATATSDAGTDLTGLSEGNKAVKFYSKKATICNDSHSIVQIDSACES